MASQTGKQIIKIHISPNISRSKDKQQAIEFGQLIKYNVTNVSFQNPCRTLGRETCFRPLLAF